MLRETLVKAAHLIDNNLAFKLVCKVNDSHC